MWLSQQASLVAHHVAFFRSIPRATAMKHDRETGKDQKMCIIHQCVGWLWSRWVGSRCLRYTALTFSGAFDYKCLAFLLLVSMFMARDIHYLVQFDIACCLPSENRPILS